MKNRATVVFVAVAVIGGAAVAGIGLATRGSGRGVRTVAVDELRGRIGKAVLGESRSAVLSVLGRPSGPAPAGALRYPHLLIGLREGVVSSIKTDDGAARTLKAVGVGDGLGAVRAVYRRAARCVKLPEKETESSTNSSGGSCTVRVPAGRLRFDGNPIRSITLTTSGRPA